MFQFRTFAAVPALVFLMGGTAHAALTADQIWTSWKDGAALAGLTITAATESNTGGVMTLNGVSIAPEGATEALTISDITLTEEADGTVTIKPGAAIGMNAVDGKSSAKVDVQHDALVIVASENAGTLSYNYSANSLNMAYDFVAEGYSFDPEVEAQPVKNSGKLAFDMLSGVYSDTPGANRAFGLTVAASKLVFDSSLDDPSMEMKSASTSDTADLAMDIKVVLPTVPFAELQGPDGFRKAVEGGLTAAATFAQGESKGTVKADNPYFGYDMAVTSAPGKGALSFDKSAFAMNSVGGPAQIVINVKDMPAPMDIALADVSMDLLVPVIAVEPADFHYKTKVGQLTLSDGVWGMFDPTAALKRDPLDLNIDISGRTTLDVAAMIEAEETGMQPPVPAPEKVDITDITLKVAGAALNATGAFTFDNSMGMPMPVGTAKVNVDGANALIDGLIKTGLLQEADASGARMMMAMFMKPSGNGDDSLTSDIEVKEGMQVLVNGQPLPM